MSMKKQKTPLAIVKSLHSVVSIRTYLDCPTQASFARFMGIDAAIVNKVEHNKMRWTSEQVERIAIEVARQFRKLTRDNWGLKYSYNSPIAFTVWGVCRNHRKPVEYEIHRMTDKCPKCKIL